MPRKTPTPPSSRSRRAKQLEAHLGKAPANPKTLKAAQPPPSPPTPTAPTTPALAAAPAAAPAPRPARRANARGLLVVGLVAFLAILAYAQPASSQGNSGTIKVHDGSAATPDERNEPHVTGGVYVEGFNMAADGGDLLFYSWPPTGNMTLVLATNWTADDGTPAFHFLAGPFDFPCGHYKVLAYNGDGPADPTQLDPGGAKQKMFWVDGSDAAPCESTPETEITCPADLQAVANDDGSVTLTWTDAAGSDGTNVYRAEGNGSFEYLATVDTGVQTYTDGTTVPGVTYSYTVTALFGDQESTDCAAVVEVTAVPELPTLAALGLATGGGALALLLARRRKA